MFTESDFDILDNSKESVKAYTDAGYDEMVLELSENDLDRLRSGQVLATNNGEFSIILVVGGLK